jgi:hypothetical protein
MGFGYSRGQKIYPGKSLAILKLSSIKQNGVSTPGSVDWAKALSSHISST